MENSNSKHATSFVMEIFDKLVQIFLEVITKVNLSKVRVTGSSLINLLLAALVY